MKRLFLALVYAGLLSSMVLAQNPKLSPNVGRHGGTPGDTTCNGFSPALVADGSSIQDYVLNNSTNYYLVQLLDGHSYSVEANDPIDTSTAVITIGALAADCTTTLSVSDIWNIDPEMIGYFSDRISWIQAGTHNSFLTIRNVSPNSYTYNIRIVDTTLRSPRWSTYSGFVTQFGLLNTTRSDISGTLTLNVFEDGSTVSVPVTIPAGKQLFETVPVSSGLTVIPPNRSGNASFAFVGPPGAITADAYFINSNATVVVPGSFNPRNSQH
jgi:hypothetical protein